MKKITIISMFIMIALFMGCSNLQIKSESGQIAAQIAAQRMGYYVGKNNPAIVSKAKVFAQGIAGNENNDVVKLALNVAIEELSKQFPNDPLLESDLKIVVSALKYDKPDIKIDVSQLKTLIDAFVNGLQIGANDNG